MQPDADRQRRRSRLQPLTLEAEGALLLGRLEGLDEGRAWFGADLRENIAKGLEFVARLAARCDEYVERTGMDAPETAPPVEDPRPDRPEPRELDLSGVSTVLWATGYRPDYGWIRLPLFDGGGRPLHRRGVTGRKGLYFVGMHWLHKRKSALLFGVGEDAEYVVSHLVGEDAVPG